MVKFVRKSTSLIVSFSLIVQVLNADPTTGHKRNELTNQPISVLVEDIPPALATVTQIHETRSGSSPILIIQDVHSNTDAQTAIAKIVEDLIDRNRVSIVGIEGAFGLFDFDRLRVFPQIDLRRKVADHLLATNQISAPSYVGLATPNPLPLFLGVDDARHYEANVIALLKSVKRRPGAEKEWSNKKRLLDEQKIKHLSKDALALDAFRSGYYHGNVELGDYLDRLDYYHPLPKELSGFLNARRFERSIDFNSLKKIRADILRNKKFDQKNNPAISDYVRYARAVDEIDFKKVLDQLPLAERNAFASMDLSASDRRILDESQRIELTLKLARLELTSTEWDQYRKLSKEPRDGDASSDMKLFEDFYEQADIRSEKIVENLIRASHRSISSKPVVLVVGGFHTSRITQLLRERNMGYALATPRLSKLDTNEASYLSAFSRNNSTYLNPSSLLMGSGRPETMGTFRGALALLASLVASIGQVVPASSGVRVGKATADRVELTVDGSRLSVRSDKPKLIEAPLNQVRIEAMAPFASLKDDWAKKKWGPKSLMYILYTTILVNWEYFHPKAFVFVPWIIVNLDWATSWVLILFLPPIFGGLFALIHQYKSGRSFVALWAVGSAMAYAPFVSGVQDALGIFSFVVPMGIHTLYNTIALMTGWTLASTLDAKVKDAPAPIKPAGLDDVDTALRRMLRQA